MTKSIISIILSAVYISPVYAQEPADTLKSQELNEVVVEAQMQQTFAISSAYIHEKACTTNSREMYHIRSKLAKYSFYTIYPAHLILLSLFS